MNIGNLRYFRVHTKSLKPKGTSLQRVLKPRKREQIDTDILKKTKNLKRKKEEIVFQKATLVMEENVLNQKKGMEENVLNLTREKAENHLKRVAINRENIPTVK